MGGHGTRGPADAHGPVHLLQRGNVARLLEELNAHGSLSLPLCSESMLSEYHHHRALSSGCYH